MIKSIILLMQTKRYINCISNKAKLLREKFRKIEKSFRKKVVNPGFWLRGLAKFGLMSSVFLFLSSGVTLAVLSMIVFGVGSLPFCGWVAFGGSAGTVMAIVMGVAVTALLLSLVSGINCLLVRLFNYWWEKKVSYLREENALLQVTADAIRQKKSRQENIAGKQLKRKNFSFKTIREKFRMLLPGKKVTKNLQSILRKATAERPNKAVVMAQTKSKVSELSFFKKVQVKKIHREIDKKMVLIDEIANSSSDLSQQAFIDKSYRILEILHNCFQKLLGEKLIAQDFSKSCRSIAQIFRKYSEALVPLDHSKEQSKKSLAVCKIYYTVLRNRYYKKSKDWLVNYKKHFLGFKKKYCILWGKNSLLQERLKLFQSLNLLLLKLISLNKQPSKVFFDSDNAYKDSDGVFSCINLKEIERNFSKNDKIIKELADFMAAEGDLVVEKGEAVRSDLQKIQKIFKSSYDDLMKYVAIAYKENMDCIDSLRENVIYLEAGLSKTDNFFTALEEKMSKAEEFLLCCKKILPEVGKRFFLVISCVLDVLPEPNKNALQEAKRDHVPYQEMIKLLYGCFLSLEKELSILREFFLYDFHNRYQLLEQNNVTLLEQRVEINDLYNDKQKLTNADKKKTTIKRTNHTFFLCINENYSLTNIRSLKKRKDIFGSAALHIEELSNLIEEVEELLIVHERQLTKTKLSSKVT